MEKDKLEHARRLIDEAKAIVITTHRSPDGDAIGSSLALWHFLRKLGKDVVVIVPNDYPKFLKWMSGTNEILVFEEKEDACTLLIEQADLIFSLDYNVLHRTHTMEKVLKTCDVPFILIDHHQQPGDYPEVTFSDTSSCSTCQMIYQFIDGLGGLDMIDADSASCIYCGIMTDSGSFRFSSVSPKTHLIAARLIEQGLDHAKVHQNVYDTNRPDKLKLLGYALCNKLEIMDNWHTAIISLTESELDQFHYRHGDTEGLVNFALSLEGVNLAIFIRESRDMVKMSFRSKGSFDVNDFARKYFDGGGHVNASGAAQNLSIKEVLNSLKSALSNCVSELDY